jgi:hypothetical protein
LVKGLARGLNAAARVASPTYALVHEYPGGRLPLFHLDLYRLDTREQIIAAGLEPYLVRPDGVTVVEWVERWLDGPCAPSFANGHFAARNSKPWAKPIAKLPMKILAVEFSSAQRSVGVWEAGGTAGPPLLGGALEPPAPRIQNSPFTIQLLSVWWRRRWRRPAAGGRKSARWRWGWDRVPTREFAAPLRWRKDGSWAGASACWASAAPECLAAQAGAEGRRGPVKHYY